MEVLNLIVKNCNAPTAVTTYEYIQEIEAMTAQALKNDLTELEEEMVEVHMLPATVTICTTEIKRVIDECRKPLETNLKIATEALGDIETLCLLGSDNTHKIRSLSNKSLEKIKG